MSDVLLVYVREDEERADALADLIDAVGFSVDGFSDYALSECSAAVIVWSPAAGASRRFREATARAVEAGKAVVASFFILPPPFARGAPVANLRGWSGGCADPALDALFLELDARIKAPPKPAPRAEKIAETARFSAPPLHVDRAALNTAAAALVLGAGLFLSAMSFGGSSASAKLAPSEPGAMPLHAVTATAEEMQRAPAYIPEPADIAAPQYAPRGREPASAPRITRQRMSYAARAFSAAAAPAQMAGAEAEIAGGSLAL